MFYLQRLDAEWSRICRSSSARRAVYRWGLAHPALRGVVDLDDILERRRDPELAQPVLLALAELAHTDQLAARTLLQALLPGLTRIAVTAGNDDPVAIEELVSLAWERIRTYPTERPGTVSGNVLLDVKKGYRRHRGIEAPLVSAVVADDPLDRSAEEEALDQMTLEHFVQRTRGVVGDTKLGLIVRTRVVGRSMDEIAKETGVHAHTLYQRRWWAERKLRELQIAS